MSRKTKGFTLAELLVVVAVIAVLSAIAIPVFASSIERAQEATCIANRRSLLGVLSSWKLMQGEATFEDALNAAVANNAEDLADWKNIYVCPAGGEIYVRKDAVRCKTHRTNDYQNSTAMLDRYLDISDKWLDYKPGVSPSNDLFRKYYFETYCTEENTWPKLQVGDNTFYVQPYVDIYGTDYSGDMFLFANRNPDYKSSNWNVNCIYDAEEDAWYTSKNGTDTLGIADKEWGAVKALMQQKGWVKTDAIEIDPVL